MKKKFKLLLFLVILLIPVIVKADMGGVIYRTYKMVVIDPNGIDYYAYDQQTKEYTDKRHLNKGETFNVEYEYNNIYNISIEGEEYFFEIKSLDGTALFEDELNPEKAIKITDDHNMPIVKITTKNEALIYAEDGVDIRKGPATIYDKIGHIDKGTAVKYSYYISDSIDIYCIYIEYNGIKGWITRENSEFLLEPQDRYILRNDAKIACKNHTKNSILTPKYITHLINQQGLFEYNCEEIYTISGSEDLIKLANEGTVVIAKQDLDVYEYSNNNGQKIITIPADTEFVIRGYYRNEEIFIAYDNKSGWIKKENIGNYYTYSDNPVTPTTTTTTEEATTPVSPEEDPTTYMTTYVIIGATIALTALIVVVLINDQKMKKKEEKGEL